MVSHAAVALRWGCDTVCHRGTRLLIGKLGVTRTALYGVVVGWNVGVQLPQGEQPQLPTEILLASIDAGWLFTTFRVAAG